MEQETPASKETMIEYLIMNSDNTDGMKKRIKQLTVPELKAVYSDLIGFIKKNDNVSKVYLTGIGTSESHNGVTMHLDARINFISHFF